MGFTRGLILAALGAVSVLGLPAPDGTFFIQNTQTGWVFDNFEGLPTPGNVITAFELNGGTNQMWTVEIKALVGSSGVYEFTGVAQDVSIYVSGSPGAGLVAEPFTSAFSVNPIPNNRTTYTITIPLSPGPLAVTADPSAEGQQITLQTVDSGNTLQQWVFVSAD